MKKSVYLSLLAGAAIALVNVSVFAQKSELFSMELPGGDVVDIRQYKAEGDKLLLGFACDEGTGEAEMNAASLLSDTDMEIWMPDLLTAHFLPKLKSSLIEIPSEDVVSIINAAIESTDKQIYLISSGQGSAVLLRGLAQWEQENPDKLAALKGVVLLYPSLNSAPPEPGKDPIYIDAVGKTKTSIAILEGSKTPNSWALPALKEKLQANGSMVTTALIPGVRGFFYERDKQSWPEDNVTSQLAGLVRASVIKLNMLSQREMIN